MFFSRPVSLLASEAKESRIEFAKPPYIQRLTEVSRNRQTSISCNVALGEPNFQVAS